MGRGEECSVGTPARWVGVRNIPNFKRIGAHQRWRSRCPPPAPPSPRAPPPPARPVALQRTSGAHPPPPGAGGGPPPCTSHVEGVRRGFIDQV
eukprot:3540628-Pyramimonas_sp.AAC.1